MALALGSGTAAGLLMSLVVLLVVCPAPISASLPKRPHTFTVYVHENRGTGENSTLRTVTNSTLGLVSVLNQPLREGVLPTSKLIGKQVGMTTELGFSGEALYGAFDFQIQSGYYNGTFLAQGSQNILLPVRTLAILGGTGDFYLARGYATITTVAGSATTGVYKYVVNFKY